MRILVTGGAGYIGTHTLVSLLSKEHEICVVDNYANSSPIALDRVRRLTNHDFEQHELDIGDSPQLSGVYFGISTRGRYSLCRIKGSLISEH